MHVGLVLASNRHLPVKKAEKTLGLAISTLHHSGDQVSQILRLLELSFDRLLVSDRRSTTLLRILEKIGLAARGEGQMGTMKPTALVGHLT